MSHPPVKLSIVWNLIVGCALMSTEILHFRTWLKSRKRKLGVGKYVNINHISILPAYCKSCIELVPLCSHSGHDIFSAVVQLRRHMIGNRWTTLTIRTSQCFSRVSEINLKKKLFDFTIQPRMMKLTSNSFSKSLSVGQTLSTAPPPPSLRLWCSPDTASAITQRMVPYKQPMKYVNTEIHISDLTTSLGPRPLSN